VIRLHDTATGEVRELALREPGKVSMYVCGPTVSGDPHLGHGRYSLVFDVLRRYLSSTGLEVRYVSNVTDIEDKILAKAAEEGVSDADVAARYEISWWRAMDALGVLRPSESPHATAYVEHMVALIGRLLDADVAYRGGNGIYFSAAAVEGYGLLARQSLESLREGGSDRMDAADDDGPGAAKRHPADFALWKDGRSGERTWPAPFGEGRPGWHTECVVMSLDLLGEGFDLHGGGLDLSFPHHENERAQALADGRTFAAHWVHNGMLTDEGGEKMSKSVGNTIGLLDLVDRWDARAYRMLVLQAHYRSPMKMSDSTLDRAERTLGTLDRLVRRAAESELDIGAATIDPALLAEFRAAMDDDLDTPRALALVFEWARQANSSLDREDWTHAARLVRLVQETTAAVGLSIGAGELEIDAASLALASERDAARARRDFAAADQLRDELKARGWLVEDAATGTKLRRP
jgi:cysteinyl-tRNA synthetase